MLRLLACSTASALAATFAVAQGGPSMPIRVTGPWSVAVGPGVVHLTGRAIVLAAEVAFDVPPSPVIEVTGETFAQLPLFNPNAGPWARGAKPSKLITEECTATGCLLPESFVIRSADGATYVLDQDYTLDGFWANFGRIEGGTIPADQPVLVDYRYSPHRLDSIVANERGAARLIVGEPNVGDMLPPTPAEGEVAIANLWVPGRAEQLTEENLFPIEALPPLAVEPTAGRLLPKTLAKLRAGEEVKIVAWGDSVTCGGGVGADQSLWYQYRFQKRLQERFPRAKVTMVTAGWGGQSSGGYMAAPPGGTYDFKREVLDSKPDLVTIEFVNDAGLNEEQTQTHYATIMEHMRSVPAEVILITPHLVRPDWLGVTTLKFDDDPRPYVKGLRRFARENDVALADASALWCRLYRQGIPYVTLEANSINHPDVRGMDLFVEALMGVFPEG
jgi:lysophospholipase L1-like esterase